MILATFLLVAACQDLVPGVAGQPGVEGRALAAYLAQNGAVANVQVTLEAEAGSACGAGEESWNVQFATSRRFRGANGFALANGWLEDLDDDGLPTGNGGCADASGAIAGGTPCSGADPVLSSLLNGSPSLVEGARLVVTFDVVAAATLMLDWSFVTFERPVNTTFFDAFGIVFDDGGGPVLLAGGTTNGGPEASSVDAGWSLFPSPPNEYQHLGFPGGFHQVPAFEVLRRPIALALSPGAGQRLSFHVADSGPTIPMPPSCSVGETSADSTVHSALFVSTGRYAGPAPNGVTPGVWIDRIGHPGSVAFPGDFGIEVGGNLPGAFVVLGSAGNPLPPIPLPQLAPWTLYVAPIRLTLGQAGVDGIARFPYPVDLSSLTGDFFVQGVSWELGPVNVTASAGLRVLF